MARTAIPGVTVGHWSDPEARTGCTVLLFGRAGGVAGVDVRGSAPGTRETDILGLTSAVERVHGIALCGGSAFGLAAADGVMRYLADAGVGFEVRGAVVPIVPAAVVFDLAVGSATAHPGPDQGIEACRDALRDSAAEEGQVGAGTGATVGKIFGMDQCMAGGIGVATLKLPGGATVWALAVTNAFGDVVDRQGKIRAGARNRDLGFADTNAVLLERGLPRAPELMESTTLGVIATDAELTRPQCQKVAELAHDALALAIRPVHTMFDGDTVFAVSTGSHPAEMLSLGAGAVEVMRRAIERSVRIGRHS